MKKKIIIITLAVLAVIVGIVYSIQKKNTDKETEAIKIGVIMPQTGYLASPGKNTLNGINLYCEEYNNLSDKKIQILCEDSKSETKTGVSALNKLIFIDKVKLVIGDLTSQTVLAMAPIAEQNKVVLITPGGSSPAVREAGDYIFRIYTSDDFDGKVMADYLINKRSVKEIALLHFTNDYGIGLSKSFADAFQEKGGQIPLTYNYEETATDFRDVILRLKKNAINDVYFIGSPKQDAYFVKQVKELGLNTNIYGVLSFDDEEFVSSSKNSFDSAIYTTMYFDLNSTEQDVIHFKECYKSKYDEEPDINAALGYDVAKILISALQNADFGLGKVKDELYKIQNFKGITGNTSFDEKGDVNKPVMIKKVTGDGERTILDVYSLN